MFLSQGAEAILVRKGNILTKKRIEKGYRHKEIDKKVRKFRTRRETKLLEKTSALIPVPRVIESDDKEMVIRMDFIEGELLRDILDTLKREKRIEICKGVGGCISKLHENDIIHGDLTTSNMLLYKDKIFFIDFGLGFISKKDEDKAVDLHLLKQALESKHYQHYEESFDAVLEGYKNYDGYKEIIARLEKVERRGRYKKKSSSVV